MRFGRLASRDQTLRPVARWRLFQGVTLLGLVVIGIEWSAQKRNWAWITGRALPNPTMEQVTPRRGLPGIDESPSTSLPLDRLSGMDDRRLGLLREEQTALDTVIKQIRTLSDEALTRDAVGGVEFVTLHDRPGEYRGRLMRFEGTLWQLSCSHEGEPSIAEDDLYEAWLFPPDAGNNPLRVLCTAISPTLRIGKLNRSPSTATSSSSTVTRLKAECTWPRSLWPKHCGTTQPQWPLLRREWPTGGR